MTEATDNSTESFHGNDFTSNPIKKIYPDDEEKVSLFMDDSVTGSKHCWRSCQQRSYFIFDEEETSDESENVDDDDDDDCDKSSKLIQTKNFIVLKNCLDDILICLIGNNCKCAEYPSNIVNELRFCSLWIFNL